MIVCPRCSYENEDSSMNCASCRAHLQWALENWDEAVQHNLEGVEGPPPEAQAGHRVLRGFLVIVLLLAVSASGFLALSSFLMGVLSAGNTGSGGYLAGAGFWLVVAVVCILATIAVLLPGKPRARYNRGLRILGLIGATGGLLFGLARLAVEILPEHTGRSLIIQYTLGERDFREANLEQADLSGAKLYRADLSEARLYRADLGGATLYRADLSRADLSEADLTGAHLLRTDLRGADLSGANLRGAFPREANLSGANLSGADLSEADLTGADLSEAVLRGADLTGAKLYWTNVSGADLREADLTGADLSETILRGADLTGAAVTNEQLDRAWDLEGTILPDGSVHE